MRFHSAPVIRLADAKPMQLGHTVEADGRWRLFAFADRDASRDGSRLRKFCDVLANDPASPIVQFTASGEDIDAVIDLRAVFQQKHRDLAIEAMPDLLKPQKGRYGLVDYEKMFCPDFSIGADIFDLRGIDRNGCLVVVRPDQYVATILPLACGTELRDFFGNILRSHR